MWRRLWHLPFGVWIVPWLASGLSAQQKTLTWDAAKRELHDTNPILRAGQIGIRESRAEETTAFLRPNPNLIVSVDQVDALTGDPYRPFTQMLPFIGVDYLHERRHKRELRLESAKQGTEIAVSQLADQERNLLFDLRTAFVQALHQKAILAVARENLGYYDRVLEVSRDRFKAGDIAEVDLDRLELQRVQFESDVETASVNLRTAKIQFRALLNDRTPVEQLDVAGPFEYTETLTSIASRVRIPSLRRRTLWRDAIQARIYSPIC
jgi:cobalt-zinc-cadmium efflux system outer membrane protein